MYSTKLEDLLKDGYTKKFAMYYLGQAQDYESIKAYDKDYAAWALSEGFLADSAYWYGLNEDNYKNYLTDYDYYKVWPLNNWTRIWINDKLTLKHMLGASEFGCLMPDYYYYTAPDGLVPLSECPIKKRVHDINDFIEVLKIVKNMACKPCNGTSSLGFFKLSYEDGELFVNDTPSTQEQIADVIKNNPNYVFTQYLVSSGYLGRLSAKIHTLRLVVINPIGKEPKIIGGYLRIPTPDTGAANYLHLEGDDVDGFNIVADVNSETGEWGRTKKIFVDKAVDVDFLPGTNLALHGVIENYQALKQYVLGIADRFRNVEYMGFDLCVSQYGFKMMEINSHPGMRHMQIFRSFLADDFTKEYFLRKLDAINRMSETEKLQRNLILR